MTDTLVADDENLIGALTLDEFDALTDEQQREYLLLLQAEADAWVLHPRQQEAHDCKSDEILFGGAAGGGKSEALVFHAYDLSLRFPGHHSLLIRKTHPNLRRSLIRRCHERFDRNLCTWRAADKEYRFENGSIIEFGFAESDDDVMQYLSAEYDFIGFEEATELSEYRMSMIGTRCRTTVKKARQGIHPHIWYTTNPGGPGHAYLKRRFVEPTNYGEIPVVAEPVVDDNGESVLDPRTKQPIPDRQLSFIPSTILDNPDIDPQYISRIAGLPETQRRMYMYGDWDVFEGKFFTEFDRAVHVIDLPASEIPASWPRWCAFDWGYSAPWCALWFALDPDENVIIYRELYQAGLLPSQQAQDWKEANKGEYTPKRVADPAVFKDGGKGSGHSTAAMWRKHGLDVSRAKNERIPGWIRLREYLATVQPASCRCGSSCDSCVDGKIPARPRYAWASDPDLRAGTGLYIANCPNLVAELTGAMHDPKRPEDLVGVADRDGRELDHALDTARYGVMLRPPRRRVALRERAVEQAETFADRFKARKTRKRRVNHPEMGSL